MQLLVLGGTGRVGQLVVDEVLRRGHAVTVLVRLPQKLAATAGDVTVMQGDALDPRAVATAVSGQDAVIYVIGVRTVRRTTVFSESTGILLAAMQQHSVRRLVCVTGVGAGDTKGHGGFLYDRLLYPLFTKRVYEDKDRQESLIRQSGLEWTIVRPAMFRTRTPRGSLRVVTHLDRVVLRKISVHEVAVFLVEEVESNRYVREAVFIGHE